MTRRTTRTILAAACVAALGYAAASVPAPVRSVSAEPAKADKDPLPSWKDGKTKQAVLKYVADVTTNGGPKFVPPEERIATFDNDGTLWCEHPVVQMAFIMDRLKELVEKKPELKEKPSVAAALKG